MPHPSPWLNTDPAITAKRIARLPRGETHHNSRLDPDKVRFIREQRRLRKRDAGRRVGGDRKQLVRGGMTIPELAQALRVSERCINDVLSGKTWKHVT